MDERTYEEVLFQIENQRRFGRLAGVEITAHMLQELHNPQQNMKIIHIAGTNGKGSVAAFLCTIMREAGYKTGMFISPHLVEFEERIQVDGRMIEKKEVRRLGDFLLEQDFSVTPTMFDYCLLMAVLYFKEQKCDVIILETGLGGRLDSTNALGVPVVSVITKIGYDHMAILGDTLAQIASEKAGIIKTGSRLILESQEREALNVLCAAAKKAGVRDYQVVPTEEITETEFDGSRQFFSFRGYRRLSMQLLGVHQYENAAAAVLAAEAFFEAGQSSMDKTQQEACIREGIRKTRWQGRMEVISQKPFFMVDGAHNSNGVRALEQSLKSLFPGERFHFIMGVMADKDYEKMIEELLPLALDFKTVTVESERALAAENLAGCIRKKGVPAACCMDIKRCILPETLDEKNKTIAFGSLYFVGEIMQFLDEKRRN